jgi:aspartokinase-like uncharacterized kinase
MRDAQHIRPPSTLTVVKLGGSYARSPNLAEAVAAITGAREAVAIVPGGGPFADTVREMQGSMEYDDRTAHRMAILAMCQFAESIAMLNPRLRVANNLVSLRRIMKEGFHAVWSPWPLADGLETMPPSWDITSDSLAAWLAGKLRASRLVLLKSANPSKTVEAVRKLVSAGVVDPQFPAFLREADVALRDAGAGVTAWCFGSEQLGQLSAFLDGGGEAGARIICQEGVDI